MCWKKFLFDFSRYSELAFGTSICLCVGLALLPRRNDEANVLNVCWDKKYDKNYKTNYILIKLFDSLISMPFKSISLGKNILNFPFLEFK